MTLTTEKKTIVFDLEETLLHISLNIEGADMIVPVKKKNGPASKVL
jgi:FMN phosphatase YigB (HAD superfamily)